MNSLELMYEYVSESKIANIIMDACRSNPRRNSVVTHEVQVKFVPIVSTNGQPCNDTHVVLVLNHSDVLLAMAFIDQYDI